MTQAEVLNPKQVTAIVNGMLQEKGSSRTITPKQFRAFCRKAAGGRIATVSAAVVAILKQHTPKTDWRFSRKSAESVALEAATYFAGSDTIIL